MKEIFLAVFDGTDECKSAVRYAARRAQLNNANLLIVATVDTAEFTYWLSVNSKMIDNIEKESKEMLKVLSKEIQSYSNVECSYLRKFNPIQMWSVVILLSMAQNLML